MVSLSDIQYIKTRDKKEGLALLKRLLKIKNITQANLEAHWHEVKILDENDAKDYIVAKNKEAKKKPVEKKVSGDQQAEEKKEESKEEKKKGIKDIADYFKNLPHQKKRKEKITNFFKKDGVTRNTPVPKKKKEEGPHEKHKMPLVRKKDTARKEFGKNQSIEKKKGQIILDDYIRERTDREIAKDEKFNKVADFINTFQDPKKLKEYIPSVETVWSATKNGAKSAGNVVASGSKFLGKGIYTVGKGIYNTGKGIVKGAKFLGNNAPQILGALHDINSQKREWNKLMGKKVKKHQKYVGALTRSDRTADIINNWNSYQPKQRYPSNKLEQIMFEARQKQARLVERLIQHDKNYIKQMKDRNPLTAGPPPKNEFGEQVNELPIVSYTRPGHITRDMDERARNPVSRDIKRRILRDQQRDIRLTKHNNEEEMKKILEDPDKVFVATEEMGKRVGKGWRDLITRETASLISHPEELKLQDTEAQVNLANWMSMLNFTVGTVADAAHMLNGKGFLQKAVDGITNLMFKTGGKTEDMTELNYYQSLLNRKEEQYKKLEEQVKKDEQILQKNANEIEKVSNQKYMWDEYMNYDSSTFDLTKASNEEIEKHVKYSPYSKILVEANGVLKTAEQKLKESKMELATAKKDKKKEIEANIEQMKTNIVTAKRKLNAVAKAVGDRLPFVEEEGKSGAAGKTVGEAVKEATKQGKNFIDGVKAAFKPNNEEADKKSNNTVRDLINFAQDSVKNLADIIKSQAKGLSSDEQAKIQYERGDMYEDRFKDPTDIMEMTMADKLKNIRNNKKVQAFIQTLDADDVNVMNELGVDIRLKNEYVKGEIMKLAHRAFLRNDDAARQQLRAKGIKRARDLLERKKDLANYCVMAGKDPSEVDKLFDVYGMLPEKEYKEKVKDSINQMSVDRGIDVAEGALRKYMELKDLSQDAEERKLQLRQAHAEKFISREGWDEQATNNRFRDMLFGKYLPKLKENKSINFRTSKMRNKITATTAALISEDGWMPVAEEKKCLQEAEKILKDNGKFILSDDYLKVEGNVEKALTRMKNYALFRHNYMRKNEIVGTQDTIDEIETGNTQTHMLMPTQGQKYKNVEEIVKKSIYGINNESPFESYELDKRTSIIREMLNENRQGMTTIFEQIEKPQLLSLYELEEMSKLASKTTKEQELKNIGKQLNEKIKTKTFNGELDPIKINYYGHADDDDVRKQMMDEWEKNIILPEHPVYHNELLNLKKEDFIVGTPVKRGDKILMADEDYTGNIIYTYKSPDDSYRHIIPHLTDVDIRPPAQTHRNTDYRGNNADRIYDNRIPGNAAEIGKRVSENENKFFERKVWDADKGTEAEGTLREVWDTNENKIIFLSTESSDESTFDIAHGSTTSSPMPSPIKPRKIKLEIGQSNALEVPQEKAKLKIQQPFSFQAPQPITQLQTSSVEEYHVSPTKPTLEIQEKDTAAISPKPELLAQNIAQSMLPFMAQSANTIQVTPRVKGKTEGTPITNKTPVVTAADETWFSPESQSYKQMTVNVTPVRKPRGIFDTSSSDESPPPSPKKTPTRLNPALFGSDSDDEEDNVDEELERKIKKINTPRRQLVLDSPIKVNMEVLMENEQRINEVAREINKATARSPIKGPKQFIEQARDIYKHAKPRIEDNKIVFKSALQATRFVDNYIGEDNLRMNKTRIIKENKRMRHDKQNDQWVVEQNNTYLQNDMRQRNLDNPVSLVEKLTEEIQKNKGASTHEISTGTPLTPAIISPPPLNSEQEGGEESGDQQAEDDE